MLCYLKPARDCLCSQTFQDPATTTSKAAKAKRCDLVAFTHLQKEIKYPVVLFVLWSWRLLETSSTAIATLFLGSDGLTHHVWISSRDYHISVLPASKLPVSELSSLVPLLFSLSSTDFNDRNISEKWIKLSKKTTN